MLVNKSPDSWYLSAVVYLKDKRIVITDSELAKALDIDKSTLSNYLSGRKTLSVNFKTKFYELYGKYLKNIRPATANDGSHTYELIADEENAGTPIYELSATASKNEYSGQLPEVPAFRVNVPGYEDCNFGMHVYGHSMYPTIENGSLILCRKVQDKSIIMYGGIYLIRTKDYLMVKRLQKNDDKSHVLCTSDNFEQRAEKFKRYEPFELAIDKIIDLYLIKGIIKKTQS